MTTDHLIALILTVEGIVYALAAAMVFRRRMFREQAARWLMLYALVACLWSLGQAGGRWGWLPFAGAEPLTRLALYGTALLGWLFLLLTRAFLRLEGAAWGWWALGLAGLAAIAVLDGGLLAIPETLWWGNTWGIQRHSLLLGLLPGSWAICMGAAAWLTGRSYRQTRQPLHKNRITYWSLAWTITLVGDALFIVGYRVLGGALRIAAFLVTVYAVLNHRLPDVRQTVRQGVSYLVITLLSVGLYTAGFLATQVIFQAVPGYSPVWAGAAVALVLAVIFQPLLGLVQRQVSQLMSGTGYDPSRVLREHGASISNILDLELLANMMLNLIVQAMKIRHSHLFVVDRAQVGSGAGSFCLRQVGRGENQSLAAGLLEADSPMAGYLCQEAAPLTQYDIDLLARFQAMPAEERAWLSGLDADVYVPIHAKGEWIGLLTLGPKLSGDRYFDDDLVMLRALADQTAVALDNARLVEDLIRAHNDLGQTYAALAQANRQLQELDKLKSAFIGVITHELRTPFANIVFSLELLERHGRQHLPSELAEQLEQLRGGVQTARTMVDNLVTFATFLSKQGELRRAPLNFGQVVQDSLLPLRTLAESKRIMLHTELTDGLPPLNGDRERLGDAVYHLAHNAIKFTPAGGQVWVRCQADDGTLRCQVQDTGIGVPADKLPALWQGFTQMADPLRRGVEGLGLGLALVKYVVNAHGGQVWADSQPGAGSTFGFELPLRG